MQTKRRITKILMVIAIGALVLSGVPGVFAVENSSSSVPPTLEELKNKMKTGTVLLRKIENSLQGQKSHLSSVSENIHETKTKIKDARLKIQGVKGQLLNLQKLAEIADKKQLAIRRQIAERENEMTVIRHTLAVKRVEQQQLLQKIQAFNGYQQTSNIEQNDFSSLSLLVAFNDLGEGMKNRYFTALTQNYFGDLFLQTDHVNRELSMTAQKLEEKQEVLKDLQERQEAEDRNLEYHREAQKNLLLATRGQQDIYEQLLDESQKEEDEVKNVIDNLKENYQYVEKKVNDIKQDDRLNQAFSVEDYASALNSLPLNTSAPLQWPVNPSQGISAYFHDESYRAAMGVPHEAIDIRTAQGTKIRAPQTGVVYKVKNSDDSSYNYVILAHRNGLVTLYGHVSDVLVKEGDTVFAGEPFALSGGIPGSRGAGWLTTGAHLHFEVFDHWKHVDPLEFLPLEYLPIEYIPKKYMSKLTGTVESEAKVSREPVEKVRRLP